MPHVLPFHYYLYSEVQHYQTGLRARGSEYPAQKNLYTIEEVECFSNLHLSHPAKAGWVLGQTGPLSMGHTALQHTARATVSVSGQHRYTPPKTQSTP